jgi:alpha/beta hydrolase fold
MISSAVGMARFLSGTKRYAFQLAPLDPMLAGLPHGVGVFCDARIISIAGTSPRKGISRGTSDFYREAGPKDAPTLLLLHGLPSSSRMFEPLFARLSDRSHLVAPDYPGFGHSDWPDPKQFAYTFDHFAQIRPSRDIFSKKSFLTN